MPTVETYQIDVFAIIVLIVSILIIVFLIIAAIYFNNLMNLKPPSRSESSFLFWTSIVMAVIFAGIFIYAIVRILTHRSVSNQEIRSEPETIQMIPNNVPIIVPRRKIKIPENIKQVNPNESQSLVVSSVPKTDVSVNLSDIPLTQKKRSALEGELINLGEALDA
jgi:sensor histidine kinase regulating citrate/malate metabolism